MTDSAPASPAQPPPSAAGALPGLPAPLDRDAARAIVQAAVDRYIAARHARVEPFIDANYTLLGSLRLHRRALGLDLLRAPANVALAVPYLASRLAASGLAALGAARTADQVRGWKLFLETDVARELSWRLYTQFLELPYEADGRRSDVDALAAEVAADARVAAILHALEESVVRSGRDPAMRRQLGETIEVYVQSRSAAAELVNNVLLASAGAGLFKQLTPGALSLGPVLAGAVAQHAAIATFPLGATAGGMWYGVFSAAPSTALVAGMTGGLIGLGAVVTAFAGVVADPLQRATGVHRRRLHRFIDVLAGELKGHGSAGYAVSDHYVARIFDLVDVTRLALNVARA